MHTCLICLQGLSGSGKTTVATFLASTLKIPVYHSDVERKKLFGLKPNADSSVISLDIYSEAATKRTFRTLYDRAFEQLSAGQSVVLDAAFLKYHERQTMKQLAQESGVRFLLVQCQAEHQVMVDRIKTRRLYGNDPSEATEDLVLKQKQWQEALTSDEVQSSITVCTEDNGWQKALLQWIYRYIA